MLANGQTILEQDDANNPKNQSILDKMTYASSVKNEKELEEKLESYSEYFIGQWSLESQKNNIDSELSMITDNFKLNNGDVSIQISSYLNISSIDMSIQEGKYLDERMQLTITDVDTVSKIVHSNQTTDDEIVIIIKSGPSLVQVYSNFRQVSQRICYLGAQIIVSKNASGIQNLEMTVYDSLGSHNTKNTSKCFQEGAQIKVIGSSRTDYLMNQYTTKIWHLSFIITIFAIAATYFTIGELKEVSISLQQREMQGQRENYAKKLSLFTNCMICMWNMSYAITFFIAALYFQSMFAYFAIPAFWFFILSFIFMSRLIIMQRALINYDLFQSRDQQRSMLVRFYAVFYMGAFIMIIFFQQILLSDWLIILLSGLIWVTQIISNYKNCSRETPNIGFAVSQQLLISLFPIYLRGCPENIALVKPHPIFCLLYITIISIQFITILIQRMKGPRFIIPRRFRKHGFDYIQTFIDIEDLESSQQTENAPDPSEECIICMHNLRFEVDDRMQSVVNIQTNIYMQTPCNHKFHKKCLTNWMNIKLECPMCRKPLPPYETD